MRIFSAVELCVATRTYSVNFNPDTGKFKLDRPKLARRWQPGLYSYLWNVTSLDGKKHSLGGITERLGQRLSQYIGEFNTPLNRHSSPLHRLISDRQNQVRVQIFGPYDKTQGAKEVEAAIIRQIPAEERLNRTSGGNGGGAWSQYDDFPPSQGTFVAHETPTKYYPFEDRGTHIAPKVSPSLTGSGVYVIKRIGGDERDRYIGGTCDARKRARTHGSAASMESPPTKIARAIAQSPDQYAFGVIPSTKDATPRTVRNAEVKYIDDYQPKFNTRRGGGGPTSMRQPKDRVVKRLIF